MKNSNLKQSDHTPDAASDTPKFGRLLLVLLLAVMLIVAITFATESLYS